MIRPASGVTAARSSAPRVPSSFSIRSSGESSGAAAPMDDRQRTPHFVVKMQLTHKIILHILLP